MCFIYDRINMIKSGTVLRRGMGCNISYKG